MAARAFSLSAIPPECLEERVKGDGNDELEETGFPASYIREKTHAQSEVHKKR
jgi:hypothetical protein